MTAKNPSALLMLFLTLVAASLACATQDLYFEKPELFDQTLSDFEKTIYAEQKTGEAEETLQALTPEPPPTGGDTGSSAPVEDPDDKIRFSYSGENQSLHTGLRDRAVFLIDHGQGTVTAYETADFSEPAGCQTASGTDTLQFDGVITHKTTMSGNLTVTTEYTATGCDASATTVKYVMTGQLSATFTDGQWAGKVTGTSSLSQTWADGGNSPAQSTHAINWTITGTPVD